MQGASGERGGDAAVHSRPLTDLPTRRTQAEGGHNSDPGTWGQESSDARRSIRGIEHFCDLYYTTKVRLVKTVLARFPMMCREAERSLSRLKRQNGHPKDEVFSEIQPLRLHAPKKLEMVRQ